MCIRDSITVPAFVGGEGGTLTFTGVDAPGPALLGMDHLKALGFCVDFDTGRCVIKGLSKGIQLPRLNNRHLYIDILKVPSGTERAASAAASPKAALPSA
eukprot:15483437-Alexandrium_andersonii.AAC.1